MEMTDSQGPAGLPRAPRITNACEACRSAKVKCQASSQLGICKRCLESRRECIFKTGPRTRRPRQPKRPSSTAITTSSPSSIVVASTSTALHRAAPPPPRPSKTFTIDVPMPADDDIADGLEALRLRHEAAIDELVPYISEDDDGYDYEYEYDQAVDGMDHDWLDGAASASGGAATGSSSVLSHASSSALSATPSASSSTVNGTPHLRCSQDSDPDGRHCQDALPADGKAAAATATKKKQHAQRSRTLASRLGLQPEFNLDSAAGLFDTFRRAMLGHFHCVEIGADETVASMARERPFVLLALLAAASGCRTLQGHSLYDGEFRKILGLKFVAGGERSLELLQGLVIYVAWYPFHLRPKNKQALQYIRMAVDIVTDLELDQDLGVDSPETAPSPKRLEEIRLYLACYYLASSFASKWNRVPSITFTPHTARCCDMLEAHSQLKGDRVLAWQVRLERLVEETSELRLTRRGNVRNEYQIGLMLRGMDTQLAEWEASIPPEIAATPSIRIATLFTRMFLLGAPLLKLPSVRPGRQTTIADSAQHSTATTTTATATTAVPPPLLLQTDPVRLRALIPELRALYELYLALLSGPAEKEEGDGLGCGGTVLAAVEWGALVLAVVLGFRISMPLPGCPGWDHRAARAELGFAGYLGRLSRVGLGGGAGGVSDERVDDTGPTTTSAAATTPPVDTAGGGGAAAAQQNKTMDVLGASRIVLGVVKKKFLKRVAKVEGEELVAAAVQQQQQQEEHQIQQLQQQQLTGQAMTAGVMPSYDGCPMMDRSMEPFYASWGEQFTNHHLVASSLAPSSSDVLVGGGGGGGGGGDTAGLGLGPMDAATAAAQNDLWAAMTMGWAAQADVNFDVQGM